MKSYNKITIIKEFDIKYINPKVITIIFNNLEKKYNWINIKDSYDYIIDDLGNYYIKKNDNFYIIDDSGNYILMYSKGQFKYNNILEYIVKKNIWL